MLPDDQPKVPTRSPDSSRSSPPSVWVAPAVEELQAKLPQYEVLEILGRGGMGAVYKARQKSLKRLVAIKILPLGMADDEFKFVERFQNEAQTMAQMNHPAIVSVYDFGETSDGLLYFVMEFVDGTDVHKMIQASGRLSGEYALSITAHVCDALSYAHKRGVIHRDIKPANILIDQEGHIKVADFGLAKMNDPAQTSGLTRTNMAMGTPDYVAPEVLNTGMVADHRADIYAVGVMLYQMLTGEVPRGMFKLPSLKGVGSDVRFDAIICKAMEPDREERYQSAMEVRRDLDVILTTPQPKNDGTGVVSAKEPPLHSNVVATPARAPKRPASIWLSVTGATAVLGIAAFFIFGAKSKPDPVSAPANIARKADTDSGWSDWLGPILASGKPPVRNWRIVQDGVTTDQLISGANVIDRNVRDAAVRISYDLRDGSGVQITMRERSPGDADREIYFVDDTGSGLYIARMAPGGAITEIERATKFPSGTPRGGLRTLEFRCVGNRLEATLTGATTAPVTVSVTDATLTAGPCAVVLKKGALLKKVEVLELDRVAEGDRAFFREMAAANAQRQIEMLGSKIKELNGVSVKLEPSVKEGKVTGLRLSQFSGGGEAPDLSPVAALTDLVTLTIQYLKPADISWMQDLKLESLNLHNGTFTDISVLANMPLRDLTLRDVTVSDWSPLRGKKLEKLDLSLCMSLQDISFVKGMPLSRLDVTRTKVRDLSPIVGLPLTELECDVEARLDAALLRSVPTLKKINKKPVSEFKITVREVTGTGKVDAPRAAASPGEDPPGTEKIDWINSPPSTMSGWSSEWQLKDGILTPSTQRAMQFGVMQDGGVRLRVRLRPDYMPDDIGPQLQLTIRSGSLAGVPGRTGHIQFQTYVPNRTASIHFQDKTTPGLPVERLLDGKPRKASELASREVEWEFRAEGGEYTARVDGELVASVRDARVASGYCTLEVRPGIQIMRLETTGLTPTKAGPTKVRVETGPVIDWLKTVPWPAPWALEGGQLKASAKGVTRYLGTGRDASVRLRFLDDPAAAISKTSPPLQLTFYADAVGNNPQATYQLQIFPAGSHLHLLRLNKDAQTQAEVPTFVWKDVALPSASQKGEFELELQALAGELSIWSGTERLATTRDDRGTAGGWVFIGSPGVAISGFETSGITRGSDSTSILKSTSDMPAAATAWQDVTAALRENVAKKTGYTVDAKGVSRASGAPIGDTMVMGPSEKDRAVRVSYIGQAQVSLWFKGGAGSAYVLAAKDRVMIKRQTQKVGEADSMMPSVAHPAAFDPAQPHELVVAVHGAIVRAWLDGRHIGEVDEAALRECSIAIVPMTSATVRKVEIAELTASYSSAQAPPSSTARTFNGHRYEFVSGSFTWKEAKAQAEQRGGHLAVITSAEEHEWAWRTFSDQLPPQPRDKVWTRGWWLGASQTAFEKPWQWVTREPLEFTLWGTKEPSAAINPPRYLWMADANNPQGTSSWSAQNGSMRGGFLIEWDDAAESAAWTDWLGPILASGEIKDGRWHREDGGITLDLPIHGMECLPPSTRDGAVRMTYLLREASGVMITARDTPLDGKAQHYIVEDKGGSLVLARSLVEAPFQPFAEEPIPANIARDAERTLEVRVVGDRITATLNGCVMLTGSDRTFSQGLFAVVLKRGTLLKEVKVQALDPTR